MRSRIWESWRYISNREKKDRKKLQKNIKRIFSVSKVSIKNISKTLNRMENIMKSFMKICLRVSTVKERSI